MNGLALDLRRAARRLARTPGFTLLALATLALGIGANAALFSVVHAVLLKPLPFEDPDEVYAIWSRHTSTERYPVSLPEFCDFRDRNRTLEALAGVANWTGNLVGESATERLPGLRVSGNFFELLGAVPALGRTLRAADDTPGNEKVVVLSHGLWLRRFGADPGVVGRPITLNGDAFSVVGVMSREFVFPVRDTDLAIPLAPEIDPWRHNRESTSFLRLVGRARNGVGGAAVAADLDRIAAQLQKEFPGTYARKQGVTVRSFQDELTRNVGQTLAMLMAAVGLLLLVACANLANLMLVRATARRRELAVRQALGAGGFRLARELLAEALLLSGAGASFGVLLAYAAVPALVALSPTAMPRSQEIGLSLPVLAFTAGVALVSGIGFGLLPAWRAARTDPNRELAAGRGATGGVEVGRARGLIVGAQIALMVVLLSGAFLLQESFRTVLAIAPGFDPGALTLRLSLPRKDYGDNAKVSTFYRALEARVAQLPGVEAVGAVNHVPLNGALASADYRVEDRPAPSDDQLPTAQYRMVTPGYFAAMGVRIVAGRTLDDADAPGRPSVGIISQSLARQSFPDRDPVGHRLLVKDNPAGFRPIEIVGVAGDVHHGSLETAPEPHLYVAYHQTSPALLVWLTQNQFLVVRAAGDPLVLGEALRRAVHAVDPNVASVGARLSGSYLENATAARRFSLTLVTLFAALALAMAALGIYGVVSYTVARGTRDTGLRLALGASVRDILKGVLGEGLRRTAWGITAGLAAALAAARTFRSLLFGVETYDPWTYAAVVLVLVTVTLAACALPAWRAARLDPARALRQD
jgi:predicted permease